MPQAKQYKFVDLFAGCGGLSEGFLQSGHFVPLAHIEWELPMVQTMRHRLVQRWGKSADEAERQVLLFDIQKTDELLNGNWSEEMERAYGAFNADEARRGLKALIGDHQQVDLIIGGPPCQAYSIHGRATDKNSMANDYRNYLFESFVKVVAAFRPKAFIFENVTGMLSAKPGGVPVVDRIASAFGNIGYETLPPAQFRDAVFDANDYEVPQHRERVILMGIRQGEAFTLREFYDTMAANKAGRHLTVRDALGGLPPIYPLPQVRKEKGRNVSHCAAGIDDPHHMPRHCSARDMYVIKTWIENRMNYCSQQEAIDFYKSVTGKDTLYRKYRNLEWDKPSPTVVAHLQKDGFMFMHPDVAQQRFITVREAAALMTFPQDFAFVGNRAYCYKMIGNAVPVNFARAIAESVYSVLR